MKTLVICDDYWHPAATARQGLGALGDCGFEFEWIENAAEWSAERMASYSMVVFTKANNVSAADKTGWVTEDVQQAFLDFVREGNGLFVIHSGTAGYQDMPILRRLFGGVFLKHPPQCAVTVEPKSGHALATGCDAFTMTDEHYFMAYDAADTNLFLTTTSEHGTQPAGWTRIEGQGRICVLTPGHNVEVWLHPSYQALLRNGLNWCSKNAP